MGVFGVPSIRWQFSLRKLLLWMTAVAGYSTFLGLAEIPFEAGCFITLWLGGLITVHYVSEREAQFLLSILVSLLTHLLLAVTVAIFISIELLLRGTATLVANFTGTALVVFMGLTIPASAMGIFDGIWGFAVVKFMLETMDRFGQLGQGVPPIGTQADSRVAPLFGDDSPLRKHLR